jgi:hypothetical protein
MSKKEYTRNEWRIQKVYNVEHEEWRYRVQYKYTVLLWWKSWGTVNKGNLEWCHYKWTDTYYTHGYEEIVSFKSEALAREFIETYESYKKKMYKVAEELENPYIEVK